MMKKCIIFFLLLFALVLGVNNEVNAQFWKKKSNRKEAKEAKKESKYEKLLKSPTKVAKGIMNIYQVKGKLYLEVPTNLLGKDFLFGSTISAISDNYDGVVGAKPFSSTVVRFTMVDSTIQLRKVVKRIVAPKEDVNINNALKKNSIGSIMKVFKVEAFNEEKTAGVIDVTEYFLSDIKEMSPFVTPSLYGSAGYTRQSEFAKDRSFIGAVKSFEDNLTIKSHLSYNCDLTKNKIKYQNKKPFTAVMTRTLLLLPEEPVRPRIADYRMNIFTTSKSQISNEKSTSETIVYANRWNLVPSDIEAYKRGEKVEPVKPIVFYIDDDFPAAWKESVRKSVTDWNKVFEEIGFKNAIKALDYPKNDPQFDPDNIKYNCVRYAPTPIMNAMGPSWVDPRSGEIINASVYVYHDVVKLLNNWMFIQTAAADKNVRSPKLPEEYKQNGLSYILRHEVGHCLGLMHNMASSSAIPVDSLRSPSFTQKYGTTYSIMDYARFNYVAQPGDFEKGVRMMPKDFGVYDYFSIKWNYTYFPEAKTAQEESDLLERIVDETSGDPIYKYGAQRAVGVDPSCQMEDLSDDPVKASEYGLKNIKMIMSNLNQWTKDEDKDYSYRTTIYNGLNMQYFRYLMHNISYIGGIYLHEKHEGDPVHYYESVGREKQRESLNFILREIRNNQWIDNKEVMENLIIAGNPGAIVRKTIFGKLMDFGARVDFCAFKSKEENPYTAKELYKDIYNFVWEKTIKGKTPVQSEIELQKMFVSKLITETKLAPVNKSNHSAVALSSGYDFPEFMKEQCIKDYGQMGYDNYFKNLETVSGFKNYYQSFNRNKPLGSLFYSLLLKTQKVLNKAVKTAPNEDLKYHYKIMLLDIERIVE